MPHFGTLRRGKIALPGLEEANSPAPRPCQPRLNSQPLRAVDRCGLQTRGGTNVCTGCSLPSCPDRPHAPLRSWPEEGGRCRAAPRMRGLQRIQRRSKTQSLCSRQHDTGKRRRSPPGGLPLPERRGRQCRFASPMAVLRNASRLRAQRAARRRWRGACHELLGLRGQGVGLLIELRRLGFGEQCSDPLKVAVVRVSSLLAFRHASVASSAAERSHLPRRRDQDRYGRQVVQRHDQLKSRSQQRHATEVSLLRKARRWSSAGLQRGTAPISSSCSTHAGRTR